MRERLLKTAVRDIYNAPQPGDLCMDAPVKGDWKELEKMVKDLPRWNKIAALPQFQNSNEHFEM